VVATALLGFVLGYVVSMGFVTGHLRYFAKHKWIYDVIDSDRKGGVVTAYVMTTTVENNRALMYKGRLHEFYLTPDGCWSYVVLKDCTKYFLNFEHDVPDTSKQLSLFKDVGKARVLRSWDYLMIPGAQIANILFDPSYDWIRPSDEGWEFLERAFRDALRQE